MGSCVGTTKSKGQSNTPSNHGTQGGGGVATTQAPGGGGGAQGDGVISGSKGEIKMLLLGAGESGKSTIWKQMKLIHLEGFTEDDLQLFKPGIVENVVQLLQGLCLCAKENGDELQDANKEFGAFLLTAETVVYNDFTDKYPQLFSLWQDPAIQERANDPEVKLSLVLLDSAPYWYKNIERVLTEDYQPSIKDIIKSRTKTTGVQEIVFEIDGHRFKLTDVGGQRSERKKWIACFQNLTAILFVVALSEYDQTLNEEASTNRMTESMKLFKGVVGNDALHHVSMILFLNKEDLFSEKIKRSDLRKCFPDYNGPVGDKEAAFEYIKNQFIALNSNPNRKIYTQVTVATDIDNIRGAMDTVKDIVIEHATGGKQL
eukprot:TRINITY_DN727_c0_g1_i1.p1 TRINITY_DN727_c0_g1~~TRINITY_DN727_c0_g1_i1.p1  ORF type:complete len:373 (-),score=73.31 TRINITY_DN727_c0_g1_i1:184-1302(-)